MKKITLILLAAALLLLSGCITYERTVNGKKSGFSTDPTWWFSE